MVKRFQYLNILKNKSKNNLMTLIVKMKIMIKMMFKKEKVKN